MAKGRAETRRVVVMAHLAMLGYALIIAGSFSFGALAAPYVPPAVLNAVRFLMATRCSFRPAEHRVSPLLHGAFFCWAA